MLITAASLQQSITLIQGALQVLAALQLTGSEYPQQSCEYDGQVYDYIIVGGGTAGCVLATRLVDDNTTVLLIEAGNNPELESDIPSLMLYLKSSGEAWDFKLQDPGLMQESHKPTTDDLSLGKVLGGSSSLSYLLYSPGNKYDYDNWAKIVNDSIWDWDNVLPYLKKSQRLEDPTLNATDGEYYGQNGNIGLTVLRSAGTISIDPYFKSVQEIGQKIVPSVNGNITLGYTNAIYTISDNIRQNTALTYVATVDNPNLRILKNTTVKRIIFDKHKYAIGVEIYSCNGTYEVIKARKEVIVSAGIVNTPKLLMLSGIGPRKHLCYHDIRTISDLPVGEGFQDHVGVSLVYNMTNLVVPYRPFNPYQFPATTFVGYVSLNKSSNYPDYQSLSFVNYPQYLMRYCTFTYYYKDSICDNFMRTSVNSQMIYTVINKQKFKSRGRILLKSADYRDDPLIYADYFTVKEDVEDFARILQDFIRIDEAKTFKQIGGQLKDPKLPKCGKMDKNNFEYWKCYALYMSTSQHQYAGTCALGAVVDSRLRVYGVKRLRIVDASIMPNPTAGGTLGSTIMIAEKAADLIKEDKDRLDVIFD